MNRKCHSCGISEIYMYFCRMCEENSPFYENLHCDKCCDIHEKIEHGDKNPVSQINKVFIQVQND